MAKGTIIIDSERCKGCELCAEFCPQDVVILDPNYLNSKGYHPAMLIDPHNECTGCALCAVVCADVCITVLREPKRIRQSISAR